MVESPTEDYATFTDCVTNATRASLDTFKGGAFRNEINDQMSITAMFNPMLESSVVTAEEKKTLRLGRDLTAPFEAAPSMDEVHCRMGRYLKEVIPLFLGGENFELPPIQIISLTVRLILRLRLEKMVGLLKFLQVRPVHIQVLNGSRYGMPQCFLFL
jgi:hypothetical protein